MNVKINILELLEKDDRNLTWLANKTGLTYSSLHKLANNNTTSISFDSIIKICDILKCDISDLMELNE